MNPLRRGLGVVGLCAFAATSAFAGPETAGSTMSHVGGFDHIVTSKFNFNLNTGDFTIPGHFTATRSGTDVTADHATGNSKSKIMHAEGNVVVHQNQALAGRGDTSKFTQRPSTLTCDKLDVVVGQSFAGEYAGHRFDLVPLPHPSGASPWPHQMPGRVLLPKALALIAKHPAWRESFPRVG